MAATNLTFRLYSSTRAGSGPLWSEVRNVTPVNGVYSVELGTDTSLDPLLFNRRYWLGVKAEGDPDEMRPLLPLVSVPYAIRASGADSVPASAIPDGSITSAKLDFGAVTTAKIADSSIISAKLATNAVGTAMLVDSAITTPKIATGAVTTDKLADAAIGPAILADNSVTTPKLAQQCPVKDLHEPADRYRP
jgi:hypothetical protein